MNDKYVLRSLPALGNPRSGAMEEEHEVYGGDIPDEVEGDIEGDSDGEPDDLLLKGDDIATDEVASKASVHRILGPSFMSPRVFRRCSWFGHILRSCCVLLGARKYLVVFSIPLGFWNE